MDVVNDGSLVNPAFGIKLLVIVDGLIELGPNANHESATHGVYRVEHGLRVGEARGLKGVVAPVLQFPVIPVLHNVVDGDAAVAELGKRLLDVLRTLVALAALPEAQHPLGIQRSLAREGAVARDDFVKALTGDEVVVHVAAHLAPHGELLTFGSAAGCRHAQSAIRHVAVGLPLDAQLRLFA